MASAYLLAATAGALVVPATVLAGSRVAAALWRGAAGAAVRAATAVQATLAPLHFAASHGSDPSAVERRRLRAAGALAGLLAGGAFGPAWFALGAAAAGAFGLPRVALWRRARYGRAVEAGAGDAAHALAGALAGGGSIRGAIAAAATELDGPTSVELHRVAVDLEAGATLDAALDALVARAPSPPIVLIVAAVQLQRRSGGDLAALLRRIAASLEDQRRAMEEAATATAQARVTANVVLALPPVGMLLAELASPGLVGRVPSSPLGATLVTFAVGLQVAGAIAVRRLARVAA